MIDLLHLFLMCFSLSVFLMQRNIKMFNSTENNKIPNFPLDFFSTFGIKD